MASEVVVLSLGKDLLGSWNNYQLCGGNWGKKWGYTKDIYSCFYIKDVPLKYSGVNFIK